MTAASRTAAAAGARPASGRRPRTITAAAQRINISTRDGTALLRKPAEWQREAWAYFRAVPGVAFAAGFKGNAMSRVRLYPGIVVDPDEPPVALADAIGEEGVTKPLADAADEEMGRLAASADGMPGIMRGFAVNLEITGEANLVGRPLDDPLAIEDEEWGVYSSSNVSTKGRGDAARVLVQEREGGKPVELPPEAFFARIWRRDPQWPGDAWCNMRSVLDVCEELVIWYRVFRAIAKSGANGGILKFPSELDLEALAKAGDPDSDAGDLTELQRSYLEHVTQSIETDDSASAAMPWLLDGAGDRLAQVEWINTARRLDEKALDRIDALKGELAHGLDLPVEVIKGLGDSNHWSSWQIEDSTWKAHVEPTAAIIASGLTTAFLRPGLVEEFGADLARRVVLGIDPSALVARPNRGADARDAYAVGEISGDALRRYLGMAETDAPDDEERLRRYAMDRGIGSADLTALLMNRTVTEDDPIPLPSETAAVAREAVDGGGAPAEPDTPAEEGGDPIPATLPARALAAASPPEPAALTAAGEGDEDDDPWEALALLLLGIESTLMVRLVVAASDDLADALRRAGSRLRTAAQGDPEAREQLRGVPAEEVPRTLGLAVAAELADVDRLLDGAFEQLRERWGTWVAAAQGQVADLFERSVSSAPDPGAAASAVADYRRRADEDREAGWVVFAGLLLGVARERLWSSVPELLQGEVDPTVSVPAGYVRDALARAGGGQPGRSPVGSAQHDGPGGLTTSTRVRALLDALGATVVAWRWAAGMPARPFEPHQRLDGLVFDRWDDSRLSNPGTFPSSPYLAPGDHRGCQCSAVPVVATLARPRRDAA